MVGEFCRPQAHGPLLYYIKGNRWHLRTYSLPNRDNLGATAALLGDFAAVEVKN